MEALAPPEEVVPAVPTNAQETWPSERFIGWRAAVPLACIRRFSWFLKLPLLLCVFKESYSAVNKWLLLYIDSNPCLRLSTELLKYLLRTLQLCLLLTVLGGETKNQFFTSCMKKAYPFLQWNLLQDFFFFLVIINTFQCHLTFDIDWGTRTDVSAFHSMRLWCVSLSFTALNCSSIFLSAYF